MLRRGTSPAPRLDGDILLAYECARCGLLSVSSGLAGWRLSLQMIAGSGTNCADGCRLDMDEDGLHYIDHLRQAGTGTHPAAGRKPLRPVKQPL